LIKKGPKPAKHQPQQPPHEEMTMKLSQREPDILSAFLPVKVPRRIYESFDPAVQRFIQERVRQGEAIIQEEET